MGTIDLVAPLSGTQLWADVWAVPKGAQVRARAGSLAAEEPVTSRTSRGRGGGGGGGAGKVRRV
jgi:hypothetical protein